MKSMLDKLIVNLLLVQSVYSHCSFSIPVENIIGFLIFFIKKWVDVGVGWGRKKESIA